MAKIYTFTGDCGQTSLIGGKRVAKNHPRIEAYGTTDELTSHLGLLASLLRDGHDKAFVTDIQRTLFCLSAILATEPESNYRPQPLQPALIGALENEIDRLQDSLPPFNSFILPGGCQAASQAHVCRTVCRRAERRIIALSENCPTDPIVLKYVNRLSDYLFVLARKINASEGIKDTVLKVY